MVAGVHSDDFAHDSDLQPVVEEIIWRPEEESGAVVQASLDADASFLKVWIDLLPEYRHVEAIILPDELQVKIECRFAAYCINLCGTIEKLNASRYYHKKGSERRKRLHTSWI
jgi:hypothetical protein